MTYFEDMDELWDYGDYEDFVVEDDEEFAAIEAAELDDAVATFGEL